jgi:hydroxymethylbilane synthase
MKEQLIIGTRKSALALWQSEFIKISLERMFPGIVVHLKHVITLGDKTQDSKAAIPSIGGKGLFTAELEECLKNREIDLAVNSLKDLPTQLSPEFVVGAIPTRGSVDDVIITRSGKKLAELPAGATVGTSSLRRSSQILRMRPDLVALHIRGNVDTRIRKLRAPEGEFDAIVLARAGLQRLGLEAEITEVVSHRDMLPAPGQGALGIECRAGDTEILSMLAKLHDPQTAATVGAERAYLAGLEAGCNTPVGALATFEQRGDGERILFRGRCLSNDGARVIESVGECRLGDEIELGQRMADDTRSRGFSEL